MITRQRKIKAFLLAVLFIVSALPIGASAANVKMVKSIDLTLETPKDGMSLDDSEKLALTAAKTSYGDLAASGAVKIMDLYFEGEFDDDMCFMAGHNYLVTISLLFDTGSGYCANYAMKYGDYCVDESTFSATVNGTKATIRLSSPYCPSMQVTLTIPAKEISTEEREEAIKNKAEDIAKNKAARRGTAKPYTQAEADALYLPALATTVVTMDGSDKEDGYDLGYLDKYKNVGTLIMDINDSTYCNDYVKEEFPVTILYTSNLTEIWLSDKVDPYNFVCRMEKAIEHDYMNKSHLPFFTAEGTVFIPESSLASFMSKMAGASFTPVYTIKTYSGDVYSAQKAGSSKTKDFCTKHSYTAELMAADRIYHYEDCTQDRQWFYSCSICGKCEYNKKHTFNKDYLTNKPVGKSGHQFWADLATDEAYIGVNAAGDYVYWQSCIYCGHSSNYYSARLTKADIAGMDGTLEQVQKLTDDARKMQETVALNATIEMPDMFVQSYKNTAKVSSWASADINDALNDNLVDTSLLGGDYKKDITRLQFCSVAVRLAEELTGKSISPAPKGTFTDTQNEYVLKASSAGITSGTSTTTFSPNATLNRQQMATFLYRALRYVERNSEYAYTSYESKLGSYSDSSKIQSWAKEPMAFMNALDLIKGTSATMINPEKNCTIEQAVIVAERSIYAHQIGWYQTVSREEKSTFLNKGFSHNNYWYEPAGFGGEVTNTSLNYGDRIWVSGHRYGVGNIHDDTVDNIYQTYLPSPNPYSGQIQYLEALWFRPIRN